MSLFRPIHKCLAAGVALTLLLSHTPIGAQGKKTTRVHFPNGESVLAELALSRAERSNGLMFRERLDPKGGMLFVFDTEETHAFWMKNVRFPIDILWLDREKRIVHMARRVPPCGKEPCPSYTPLIPALYVLELTAGKAEALALAPGARLEFSIPRGP